MKHYSCDVCGKPMPKGYERGNGAALNIAVLCELDDVCPKCTETGRKINVADVLGKFWMARVHGSAEPEELLEEKEIPLVKFTGAAGNEKSEIFQRLIIFNKTHGLGSLHRVAEKAGGGITADKLRSMIYDGTTLSITEFRRIGKALEGLEKQEGASE